MASATNGTHHVLRLIVISSRYDLRSSQEHEQEAFHRVNALINKRIRALRTRAGVQNRGQLSPQELYSTLPRQPLVDGRQLFAAHLDPGNRLAQRRWYGLLVGRSVTP